MEDFLIVASLESDELKEEYLKKFDDDEYSRATIIASFRDNNLKEKYIDSISGDNIGTILCSLNSEGKSKAKKSNKREVTTDEIGEVAKKVTLETTKAMDAVTTAKDEPIIENDGQSHDDE